VISVVRVVLAAGGGGGRGGRVHGGGGGVVSGCAHACTLTELCELDALGCELVNVWCDGLVVVKSHVRIPVWRRAGHCTSVMINNGR
jgi:hypothetical protein